MESQDEIIVVDDSSQDDSFDIAKKILGSSGFNHQLQAKSYNNACSTRNFAFSIAKGDFIQWLDADDILGIDKLKNQRLKLEGSPNSIVVSPFIPFIGDPQSGAIQEDRTWPSSGMVTGADWLASGTMTIPACWLGSKQLFAEAGPWNTQLKVNQDGEYFSRVLAKAESVIFRPEVNVWYRRGVSGSVSQFTAEKAESLFAGEDAILKTALALEDSHRMRQMIANRHQHAIYTAHPYCPSGIEKAKKTLKELPKPTISNPNAVSLLSKFIALVFGWKTLNRLRVLRKQLKP